MGFMNFDRIGIFEQDGERVGLRPLEITTNWGENPILKAEVLSFFNASNAHRKTRANLKIKRVIFNDPATIVIWSDDSKTVVKCQPGDTYSKELGLAMCISKKFLGNKGNFNDEFKKWIPEEPIEEEPIEEEISVEEMKKRLIRFCDNADCGPKCVLYAERCNVDSMEDYEVRKNYKLVFENKED